MEMNYSNFTSLQRNDTPGTTVLDRVWVYVGVGIYLPLSAAITLGNILVMTAFFTTPKLKTKTNYFIVSLAAADLIVGIFSIPMWIYTLITADYKHPLYGFWQAVDMVSGVSSIMHLTCISVERGYAIVTPLKHMRIKKAVLYTAIAVSWSLGIFSSVLYKLVLNRKLVSTLITVLFFFAPVLVIFGAYVMIFVYARKSIALRRGSSLKKDLHIAYTVAVVIGVFLICWLPFFLVILLFNYCPACKAFVWDMRVVMTVKIFHYVNSVCNPIIYCVRNKRFYLAFKRILNRALCCKDLKNSQHDEIESTRMVNNRTTVAGKKSLKNGHVKAEAVGLTVTFSHHKSSVA